MMDHQENMLLNLDPDVGFRPVEGKGHVYELRVYRGRDGLLPSLAEAFKEVLAGAREVLEDRRALDHRDRRAERGGAPLGLRRPESADGARAAALKDPAWQAFLAKGPPNLQEMTSTHPDPDPDLPAPVGRTTDLSAMLHPIRGDGEAGSSDRSRSPLSERGSGGEARGALVYFSLPPSFLVVSEEHGHRQRADPIGNSLRSRHRAGGPLPAPDRQQDVLRLLRRVRRRGAEQPRLPGLPRDARARCRSSTGAPSS